MQKKQAKQGKNYRAVTITLALTPEEHDSLNYYSDELETEVSEILEEAVQDWLDIRGPAS
jgi:hypothetical protein